MSVAKLLVLFVTAFVDMVGLAMIVPLLPYYATEFGASATTVGILISAFSVAQLAVAPVWGRFSDRYGRRPAILAGLLVTAAAYVLFAFARSVPVLLATRLIQGVGGGTIGVVQAYVADAAPADERTKSLGWLSAVTSLGAVVGPAFGSFMVGLGGQAAPGLGAAALSSLVAVFAWRFLRESHTRRASGEHAAPARTSGGSALLRVITHWHEPAPRLIWLYTIAIGAFYGTIQISPLLLIERFAITEDTVGYFVMYLGGMGVIIRSVILGRMVDLLGEARLARLGIVVLAAGLALTGVAHRGVVLLLGFTLMPLGTAFLFPCLTGLLSGVVAQNERGLYMGVQHTFGGVSRVVFPIAAGMIMDRAGVGLPFWLSGLLVLATLPLASALASYVSPAVPGPSRRVSTADITAELPLDLVETGDDDASAG